MKKLAVLLVAVLAIAALSSSVFAAGSAGESGKSATSMTQPSSSFTAEDLIGLKIISETGEELGEIKSAKYDSLSGRINFVTFSRGGFLGMGAEHIAIPLEALHVDLQAQEATLLVDQGKLENVPQQAGMSDENYTTELHSHYGVSPAWEKPAIPEPALEEPAPEEESEY